ncbi:hypothetical protein ACFW5V_28675 [Streptomyces sp. NPDC058762]|uniref:hypothetical protein n=1 Tax=Streptomyces sp. NPDC058762 TaxID=3346629 RepID=UPI00369637A5
MKKLTRGQKIVLAAAALPMVAVGIGGGIGTYVNIVSVFHRRGTAAGVVAAGEGAVFVLALVFVGLTMLGQAAPLAVRAGLWLLPATTSAVGVVVAPTGREAVVFAITPMAMTVAAEGLGLLARRIVVHRTGVDVEAQRRNAAILTRIAYHRARAEHHPWKLVRRYSELAAWRLMARLGHHDANLGSALTDVQNTRIIDGANTALATMFRSGHELPAATPRPPVASPAATAKPVRHTVTAKAATPPPADTTPSPVDAPEPSVPCYEPGTPQYVVRSLWLSLGHRPTESAVAEALGDAGLPNSRAQAGKIRRQVEAENPKLPGPRAA